MTKEKKYKFQFNNDETSCLALLSLIKDGWYVIAYKEEDGYTWFVLQYER